MGALQFKLVLSVPEDVDAAVQAARKALPAWRSRPGDDRARYLFRIARVLQERAREFAVLETLDNGKPIKETRDVDVPLAAQHFFYHAGWADKLDLACRIACRFRSSSSSIIVSSSASRRPLRTQAPIPCYDTVLWHDQTPEHRRLCLGSTMDRRYDLG